MADGRPPHNCCASAIRRSGWRALVGQRHADDLVNRSSGFDVVAACSPVADERDFATRLGIERYYQQYEDTLQHPDLDALNATKDAVMVTRAYRSNTLVQ